MLSWNPLAGRDLLKPASAAPKLPFPPAFAPLYFVFLGLPNLPDHKLLSELDLCLVHLEAVIFSWTAPRPPPHTQWSTPSVKAYTQYTSVEDIHACIYQQIFTQDLLCGWCGSR